MQVCSSAAFAHLLLPWSQHRRKSARKKKSRGKCFDGCGLYTSEPIWQSPTIGRNIRKDVRILAVKDWNLAPL
eukprot:6236832-Amphidinium_carterae.2